MKSIVIKQKDIMRHDPCCRPDILKFFKNKSERRITKVTLNNEFVQYNIDWVFLAGDIISPDQHEFFVQSRNVHILNSLARNCKLSEEHKIAIGKIAVEFENVELAASILVSFKSVLTMSYYKKLLVRKLEELVLEQGLKIDIVRVVKEAICVSPLPYIELLIGTGYTRIGYIAEVLGEKYVRVIEDMLLESPHTNPSSIANFLRVNRKCRGLNFQDLTAKLHDDPRTTFNTLWEIIDTKFAFSSMHILSLFKLAASKANSIREVNNLINSMKGASDLLPESVLKGVFDSFDTDNYNGYELHLYIHLIMGIRDAYFPNMDYVRELNRLKNVPVESEYHTEAIAAANLLVRSIGKSAKSYYAKKG